MGNLEEERLLRIEENQIVSDLIILLNRAEDSHETVRQREVKLTYTEREAGAHAGAKEEVKSKGVSLSYLFGALSLIALLALGWWAMQPAPALPKAENTEVIPVDQEAERPAAEEERADNPPPVADDEEDASRTPVPRTPITTTTTIRDHRLTEPGNEVVLARRPTILQNQSIIDALKKNAALMTDGSFVPMAVAVYYNEKSPTAYNEQLTRSLGSFIRTKVQRELSMDVLTKAFHLSAMRDQIILKGTGGDQRLKSSRAKYLLLCDIRQVSGSKGYLRISLYDVARQKGFTRGKSITIRSGNSFQEKEMLLAVLDYLTEMKERGLFN